MADSDDDSEEYDPRTEGRSTKRVTRGKRKVYKDDFNDDDLMEVDEAKVSNLVSRGKTNGNDVDGWVGACRSGCCDCSCAHPAASCTCRHSAPFPALQ